MLFIILYSNKSIAYYIFKNLYISKVHQLYKKYKSDL